MIIRKIGLLDWCAIKCKPMMLSVLQMPLLGAAAATGCLMLYWARPTCQHS